MSATRAEVYAAIDGERDYQDGRWNHETTASGGIHSTGEFLVFMKDHLDEAFTAFSRHSEPKATEDTLNIIRKISAMGVACMEQNGAPPRRVG